MESEEAGSVEKGESSILGPGKERLQKKVSKCVNYCWYVSRFGISKLSFVLSSWIWLYFDGVVGANALSEVVSGDPNVL